MRLQSTCRRCGVSFPVKPSFANEKRGFYCCRDCYQSARAEGAWITAPCKSCAEPMTYRRSQPKRFCSWACRDKGADWADPTKRETVVCAGCGATFTAWAHLGRQYCSNACRGRANVGNIKHWQPTGFETTCEQCGATFRTTPKQTRGRFCSLTCWGRWSSEHVVGEAHPSYGRTFEREKERVAVACAVCGAVFEESPIHASKRVTCSRACMAAFYRASGRYAGANSPTWRGGYDPYYGPSWRPARRAARARDGVCQDCGVSPAENGKALDVHHLIPFRLFGRERHAEANVLSNLVSLCQVCHQRREWDTNRRHVD